VGGTGRWRGSLDLIATDDEQLTNAARRYFRSQPIATASMILVTAPHLVCGIPPWLDPITLTFASATDYRPIGLDSSGCFPVFCCARAHLVV
jgi:hypothetical protein